MTDLFRSLSGGLGRFVLGWILPSAVTVGLFILVVAPDLVTAWPALQGRVPGSQNGLLAAGVYTLAVLSLAALFAYVSLPVYRLLEGYTLPRPLRVRLLRRQIATWRRLQVQARRAHLGALETLYLERLQDYPRDRAQLLPTRLGNAFRALETYGSSRYSLDSQSLWYELQAVVPPQLRRDVEDGRASVDFFISSIVHLALLGVTSLAAFFAVGSVPSLVLGAVSLLLLRPAYLAAVRNMADYRFAVQAAVNVGREPLARGLGLRLPSTFQEEVALWQTVTEYVGEGRTVNLMRALNPHRSGPSE